MIDEKTRRQIEAYIPSPRDKSLGFNEYYVNQNGRVKRGRVCDLFETDDGDDLIGLVDDRGQQIHGLWEFDSFRPCEFCDGKHAVPYEKNGQMLTPYQETFRTKLFIGDLPWAGKTLFVRSYYCPTYGDSYCNGPRMDSFQINFCPHCGRDLRGDRKDGRG